MSAILGPHVSGSISSHLDVIEKWQPNLIWILDPDRDGVVEAKRRSPVSKIGGRIYVPDDEMTWRIENDPIAAANFAHHKIMAHPACYNIDYWQIENEVCQFWHQLDRLNDFMCERIRLANIAGYGAGVGATSVGQLDMPEPNRMALYEKLYPTFDMLAAKLDKHCFVFHGYGWPDLWGPWERGGAPWHIQRVPDQLLPRMPTKYKNAKFAMAEIGLDGLLVQSEPKGWKGHISAQEYVKQLTNIGQYFEKFPQIIGCTIFALGCVDYAKWGTYDIQGEVANGLAEYYYNNRTKPVVIPEEPVVIMEKKMMPTPFSQRDSRWKDTKLGTGNLTIGQSGCLLSAVASVLKDSGVDVNPLSLNEFMKQNGGFVQDNLLVYNATNKLNGAQFVKLINCRYTPAPMPEIINAINSGMDVIAQVDFTPGGAFNQHWVRLTTIDGNSGHIVDPWQPPGKNYISLDRYLASGWDAARGIFAVAFYQTPRSLLSESLLAFESLLSEQEYQEEPCIRGRRK